MRTLMLACAAAVAAFAVSAPASARECKTETVTVDGEIATLRDLGAYPNSLFAWRKVVKDKFGGEWNSWRYAKDATVDCKEITSGPKKGWQCKRKAIPCKDTLSTVVEGAVSVVAKDCKADPISGTGARKSTEKEAIEQSQWAWRIDTRKKYGKDWAKLDNAQGEDHDCRKVGSQFQCITVAVPCKPK